MDAPKPFTEMFERACKALGLIKKTAKIEGISESYSNRARNGWVPLSDATICKWVKSLEKAALNEKIPVRSVSPPLADWLAAANQQPRGPWKGRKRSPTRGPALIDENYAKAIRQRYGQIPLEVLSAARGKFLEFPFSRLYVPQRALRCQEFLAQSLEERFERRDEWDLVREVRQQLYGPVPQIVTKIIAAPSSQRLVILGSLGAGKSSLIKFLALQWAEADRDHRTCFNFPILIELRLYAGYALTRIKSGSPHGFFEFLTQGEGAFWPFSEDALSIRFTSLDTAVLFDGLDEIFDPQIREEVLIGITRLANEYPRVKIIVTSRIAGYKGDALRYAGFEHFALQDLNEDEIERFIRNWCKITMGGGQRADIEVHNLLQSIRYSSILSDLAANPLLLTIIAIPNQNQAVPTKRSELFSRCSRIMLEQWKVEEATRNNPDFVQDAAVIGYREKQIILRAVARKMASGSDHFLNVITADELEECIKSSIRPVVQFNSILVARVMIRQLRERNGIICSVGGDRYSFVHRAFFEFFCADDICQQFAVGSIDHRDLFDVFNEHWDDGNWDEIRRFICGMIDSSVLESILSTIWEAFEDGDDPATECDLIMMANWITEVNDPTEVGGLIEKVKKRLVAISQRRTPGLRYPARKEDQEDEMPYAYRDETVKENAIHAIQLLARLGNGDPEILRHLQSLSALSPFVRVRTKTIKAIAQGWADRSDVWEWLANRAEFCVFEDVRSTALQEVARHGRRQPQTLDFLKARLTDKDPGVRESAMHEIAAGWKQYPEILSWLKEQASGSKSGEIRISAVAGIAKNYNEVKGLLEWMIGIVDSEKNDNIRGTLVDKIADSFDNVPKLTEWLKKITKSDGSGYVRCNALVALRRLALDDPSVLSTLVTVLENDDDSDVRDAAVSGLRKAWRDQPKLLPLTKSVAKFDTDPDTRKSAIAELRGCAGDLEVFEILKNCLDDESQLVAVAAAEVLRSDWGTNPEVQALLKKSRHLSPVPSSAPPSQSPSRRSRRRSN